MHLVHPCEVHPRDNLFHFIEIRAARFCFLPAGVLYNTPHLEQDEY